MADVISNAYALAQRGDVAGAVQMLRDANDPTASRELAVWHLSGQMVPRDLAAARDTFEQAADQGDQVSAPVVRALLAAGVGGPRDWKRALDLLAKSAEYDAEAAAQLRIIQQMDLDADGEPTRTFQSDLLSETPHVRLFPGFFTGAECAFLIEAATPALEPSAVVDPATGRLIANPVRTSDAAAFAFVAENPAIHALNRRIAKASGTDAANGEPLQVLRYVPGQEYKPHFDAIGTEANQRVLTFLVYLNDDYERGETEFLANGLSVKGRTGDGLLFRNADENGRADPASQHAGLPVINGVKFLASRWIRQRPMVA